MKAIATTLSALLLANLAASAADADLKSIVSAAARKIADQSSY
jgi:hypothetical protein